MHGTWRLVCRPCLAAKIVVTSGVEIPFHTIAFPGTIVRRVDRRLGVERQQTGIECFLIPHIAKLGCSVAQRIFIETEVFDWRAEGVFEFSQIAIDLHALRSASSNTAHTRGKSAGLSRENAGER